VSLYRIAFVADSQAHSVVRDLAIRPMPGDELTLDANTVVAVREVITHPAGNTITPEVDENLVGASAGTTLTFAATHPDPDEERELQFELRLSEVKEKVLPELTDEWASEASEFETVPELRANLADRVTQERPVGDDVDPRATAGAMTSSTARRYGADPASAGSGMLSDAPSPGPVPRSPRPPVPGNRNRPLSCTEHVSTRGSS